MGEVGNLPDTTGLPEFFISDIETEISGPNVRIIVGCRRGEQVHWLYSAVMQAEEAIPGCEKIIRAAREATRRTQMKRLGLVDH